MSDPAMQEMIAWLNANPFFWPAFIVVARVVDVSIGTVRTICVVRGYPTVAAVLGFFEIIIWVVAVSGVLREITVAKVIAYGLGFALGNVFGMWLERKVALGHQMVMMMSRGRTHTVAFALRLANFRVTEIPARGHRGHVAMAYVLTPRRKTGEVLRIARAADPKVVTVIDDVRESSQNGELMAAPRTGSGSRTGWRAILKKK